MLRLAPRKKSPQGGWIAAYFEFHRSEIATAFSNRQCFVGLSQRFKSAVSTF